MALNWQDSTSSGSVNQIQNCGNSLSDEERRSIPMFDVCCPRVHRVSISSVVETHVPSTAALAATETPDIPTFPDTTLPWSEDFSLNGWSARMFLHQLSITSTPRWEHSDTERWLSGWTPLRLRANLGNGTSLSDAIKPPGKASATCFRTARMVRGLMRRALARGKSFRLLLRTARDTIPVIVTFGSPVGDCASWTVTSGKPLRESLVDGLLNFLRQHAQESAEIPPSRTGFDG